MSTTLSDPTAEADRQPAAADTPAADVLLSAALVSVAGLAASGALDSLFEQIDAGQVQLSGAGGLLPARTLTVTVGGVADPHGEHRPDALVVAQRTLSSSMKVSMMQPPLPRDLSGALKRGWRIAVALSDRSF